MQLTVYLFVIPPALEEKTDGWLQEQVTLLEKTLDKAFCVAPNNWVDVPEPRFLTLNRWFRQSPPACIMTVGGSKGDYQELNQFHFDIRRLWAHQDNSVKDFDEWAANDTFLTNMERQHPEQKANPLISVVTTAYKSGERILRPHQSLLAQTYTNWEWLIVDDHPPPLPSAALVKKQTEQKKASLVAAGVGRGARIGPRLKGKLRKLQQQGDLKRRQEAGAPPQTSSEKKDQTSPSPTPKHDERDWASICQFADDDIRVRAFRSTHNSGYIGSVKRDVSSLARGVWIVELDHDDKLVPEMLEWIVEAARQHPEAGFIYSDFSELYENTEAPFQYNGAIAYGYQTYIKCLVDGKWQNVALSSRINPTTVRHIVGAPNHVRVWRADIYRALNGGHNPMLAVVDDYELILRTFTESKRLGFTWLRVAKLGYLQYRNTGGSNFTLLRNDLIQQLTRLTCARHEPKIIERLNEIGGDDAKNPKHLRDWELPLFQFPVFETVWRPKQDTTITIVLVTENNRPGLLAAINSLLAQTKQDWELLVVGKNCPQIEDVMDKYKLDAKMKKLAEDKRLTWWNEKTESKDPSLPFTYAHKMCVNTTWTIAMLDTDVWSSDYLESLWSETRANKHAQFVCPPTSSSPSAPPCGILFRTQLFAKYGFWTGLLQDNDIKHLWRKECHVIQSLYYREALDGVLEGRITRECKNETVAWNSKPKKPLVAPLSTEEKRMRNKRMLLGMTAAVCFLLGVCLLVAALGGYFL